MKPTLLDIVVGAVLAFGAQILQFGAYFSGVMLGLPFTYDTAPADPGSHPDWLAQISTMSLLAAVPVLAVSFAVGWVMRTVDLVDGVRRGAIWLAIAVLWHVVVGAGNGTIAMFAAPGLWVYLAAFAAGPVLAGWVRQRRGAASKQA